MKIEDRVAMHRRMAESYRNAYLHQGVQDGEKYEAWKFAADGVYASPYFTGDQVFPLSAFPVDPAKSATMEAKAYSLKFSDWKPAPPPFTKLTAALSVFTPRNMTAGLASEAWTGFGLGLSCEPKSAAPR